jgi:NosR/NirI family nitrous oxide reductase transcriptional regulator
VKRIATLALLLAACWIIAVHAQSRPNVAVDAQLKRLFPAATAFSPKEGDPPHFKAFSGDPKSSLKTLAGVAFWTTELDPLERGYDGPIKVLVGMDTHGVLTGIIVVEHQFKGKNIRDAFKVGSDIDAVSRATISVTTVARSVRNSSRRVARQLLTAEPAK